MLHSGVWTDLGQSLAGSDGDPWLFGAGSLAAGTPVSLKLSDAQPGAVTGLVIGGSALNAPFKGGTLVPAPLVLVSGVPVSAIGEVELTANWPSGTPSGFGLYFQWWISDVAGPAGWAASNAVLGVVP